MKHILSLQEWRWLLDDLQQRLDAVEGEGERAKVRRLEYVLCLAYETGLRLHELTKAVWGDLEADTSAGGEAQWWLKVIGKGGKEREVPLSDELVQRIHAQLRERGYDPATLQAAAVPLIGRLRRQAAADREEPGEGDAALTPSGLHVALTEYFKAAAARLTETDPRSAARIAEASAHWLRHTYATHAIANGVPLDIFRENLGHEDLATTSLYIRAARDRQYRETAGRHRAKPER